MAFTARFAARHFSIDLDVIDELAKDITQDGCLSVNSLDKDAESAITFIYRGLDHLGELIGQRRSTLCRKAEATRGPPRMNMRRQPCRPLQSCLLSNAHHDAPFYLNPSSCAVDPYNRDGSSTPMRRSMLPNSNLTLYRINMLSADEHAHRNRVASRIRTRATEMRIKQGHLAEQVGITQASMSLYFRAKRNFPHDVLVRVAERLGVSTDWLLTGSKPHNHGVEADEDGHSTRDFVNIPFYDFFSLSFADMGLGSYLQPLRREWLPRSPDDTDFWITRVPRTYQCLGLHEGDIVLCSSISSISKAAEGWICIFFGEDSGPFLAKLGAYSWMHNTATIQSNDIPQIFAEDVQSRGIILIGRVEARILSRI